MTRSEEAKITIQMSSDKMEAILVLDQCFDPETLASEAIVAQALSQAIQQTPALSNNITDAVDEFRIHDFSEGDAFRKVIACGQPAIDGDDECFILSPELQAIFDQKKRLDAIRSSRSVEKAENADEAASDEEALNHKERTSFMIVKAGQRVGHLQRATDGTDGIDVCGATVPAKAGKTNAAKLDQLSIETHNDGTVYAKLAGELAIEGSSISVSPTLTINGSVDYSTGNIDFPGNVMISKGIKDGFIVESGKTITASGLVEAAELSASRDVILSVGMSGREKGKIHASRDLVTKYLDKCTCTVGNDLVVENDICDCKVIVTRDTRSPHAALIGGELCTLNECELGQVGTESGTKTVLTLGRMPDFDEMINRALDIINKCRARATDCNNRIAELQADPDHSPVKAEMMCQLQFEAAEHEGKIQPLMESVRNAIHATETGTPILTVHKELCQNTELRIGGHSAKINENIKGPISVELVGDAIICTDLQDGTKVPLSQYATITKVQDSYTSEDLPEDLQNAA